MADSRVDGAGAPLRQRPDALDTLQMTVQRTALVAHHGPVGARHGWLVLHGLDQRAAHFGRTWAVIPGHERRRVLAPEGLSRHIMNTKTDATGACWTTVPDRPTDMRDTFKYLDQVVARLDAESGDGARVLVGFSQGSIIAARWAAARDRVWDAVILWGGTIPQDVDARSLATRSKSGCVELVVGERDAYATPVRRATMQEALQAAGVNARLRTFSGGHRLDDATLAEIATSLEQRYG